MQQKYFRATRDTTFEFSLVFVFTLRLISLGLNVQMRLNKVSELIHNSTNHQNLESAGVSVHFQEIVDLVGKFNFSYMGYVANNCFAFPFDWLPRKADKKKGK